MVFICIVDSVLVATEKTSGISIPMVLQYLVLSVTKNLNQNSQAVKKECGSQKGQDEKKM